MVTQTYDLNMIPGGQIVNVHVSQYDIGRTITFNLLNGTATFAPPSGTTALIEGTKPDKKGFSLSATVSGATASFVTTKNMCAVAGKTICEFRLVQGTRNIGTANFILDVERAGLADDVDTSSTELPAYIEAAQEAAADAAESEQNAHDYSLLSKSYAVGDTGVRTGEDTDNSMYYSQIALRAMLPGTDITFSIDSRGHLIETKTHEGQSITADLGKVVGDGGPPVDYLFDTYEEMVEAIGDGDVIEGGVCYVREELIDGNTQPY